MGWYRTGTITLVSGSDVVRGAGTAWVRNALPGDILSVPGAVLEVKRIVSDTELQLATAYAGVGGAGLSYALVPTQGYVPEALQAMQQILGEFGDIWQAWQAGDLQGRGLVLKGSEDAVEDLPTEGNTAGDGYIVASSKLYVWNGAEWKYAGEMVTTPELLQLRQDSLDARDQAGLERAGAESARSGAELAQAAAGGYAAVALGAQDAALIQAGVYVSEAAGRAASVDGQAYKTQGDGYRVAAYEFRRLSSATSQLLGIYPDARYVQSLADGAVGLSVSTDPAVIPLFTDSALGIVLGVNALTGLSIGSIPDSIALQAREHAAARSNSMSLYDKATDDVIPLFTDVNYGLLLGISRSTGVPLGPLAAAQAFVPRSTPTALPQATAPQMTGWNGLIVYGQSLSVGARGQPPLSTTQPYNNLTAGGGVKTAAGAPKPLVEDSLGEAGATGTDRGETVCSGMANGAVARAYADGGVDPASFVIFASAPGQGGTAIAGLSKGSSIYTRFISHVTYHKNQAQAASKTYALHAVPWIQGETDLDNGTTRAAYKAALLQLQADIDTDARALTAATGQTWPVRLLTAQTAYKAITSGGSIALAQMDAVNANANIHFATPLYHLPYFTDGIHLTNLGYTRLGHYFGRAAKQLLVEKVVPDCIWPVAATVRGTTLSVRFRVPYKPLVLEAVLLGLATNYGFKVNDATGTVALSNFTIVNGDTVRMTLGRALDAAPVVRYALDYLGVGLNIFGGASGNLRDSCPENVVISGTTYPLWHVCPAFELSIINSDLG